MWSSTPTRIFSQLPFKKSRFTLEKTQKVSEVNVKRASRHVVFADEQIGGVLVKVREFSSSEPPAACQLSTTSLKNTASWFEGGQRLVANGITRKTGLATCLWNSMKGPALSPFDSQSAQWSGPRNPKNNTQTIEKSIRFYFSPQQHGRPVELFQCTFEPKTSTVNGKVSVQNIAFKKRVFARCTLDFWATFIDVEAHYTPASPGTLYGHGRDTFQFSVDLQPEISSGTLLEFAIGYTVCGQTYWDNNNGANFAAEVVPRPVETTNFKPLLSPRAVPATLKNPSHCTRPDSAIVNWRYKAEAVSTYSNTSDVPEHTSYTTPTMPNLLPFAMAVSVDLPLSTSPSGFTHDPAWLQCSLAYT